MTATDAVRRIAPERLRTRLENLPADPLAPNRADAAVLILLRFGTNGVEVLAEERAVRPGDPWSGQVGLPGGRRDPSDRSLSQTAVRELHEEVELHRSALVGPPRLFGVRRARPSGLRVAVFAGLFTGAPEAVRGADLEEVATTFWLPLDVIEQPETRPRPTMFGEMDVETAVFGDHVVWGFTLHVLRDFVHWLQASDPATPSPEEMARPWRSQAL
ncbi:MAG: CoA pyrophosphatase [Thermoplasmata archaeon]|nr:CoA pyrophosphatase [Thermoplasmata archaeon]